MLTLEENRRLTETGPGTPAGELLRRYWHPVLPSAWLSLEQVRKVRLMCEDLVIYRTSDGRVGLVEERCPHRSLSLSLGIVEPAGLRCAYHGWLFDEQGNCLEQPFEETGGGRGFKEHACVKAYPTEELGGLIFAYLGPSPAPLVPRYDLLVDPRSVDGGFGQRYIDVSFLPCNWVQCQENSVDPVHFEWLHGHMGNKVANALGVGDVMTPRRHLKVEFELFEFGIMKRRLVEGDDPATSEDWNVGHPMLFPNILAGGNLQWRVPIDDSNTLHFYLEHFPKEGGEAPLESSAPPVVHELPLRDEKGELILTRLISQDMAAWALQGQVTPREREHLGKSDIGVTLFRRWLFENMERVARGEDPGGLIRDPAMNQPFRIPGMSAGGSGGRLRSTQKMSPYELQVLLESAARGATGGGGRVML